MKKKQNTRKGIFPRLKPIKGHILGHLVPRKCIFVKRIIDDRLENTDAGNRFIYSFIIKISLEASEADLVIKTATRWRV